MTLHRSTWIPAPEFRHPKTQEPVQTHETLERLLLRTEQTGCSVGYSNAGANLYLYSLNNPAKWTDPSGLDVTIQDCLDQLELDIFQCSLDYESGESSCKKQYDGCMSDAHSRLARKVCEGRKKACIAFAFANAVACNTAAEIKAARCLAQVPVDKCYRLLPTLPPFPIKFPNPIPVPIPIPIPIPVL